MGFIEGCRHDHTLARREAVGLDDDGRALGGDVFMRLGRIGKCLVRSRRNVVPHHEGLGIVFGAFQLRSRLGGAEDLQAGCPESVNHAGSQRRLGAHHGESDFFLLGKRHQLIIG
jgi:hypothetical protein